MVDKIKKIEGNRVLYCKKGRANWHPVMSVDPNLGYADEVFQSKKAEVIADCIKGGACMPDFKDVIELNGKEV